MEHVTKKCPYCGEEILAVAKKCKYCGEWLDAEIQETEKPEPATSENKPETKYTTPIDGNTHSKILLVGLIGVAVAFALFWFVKCDSPKTATGKGLKEAVDTAEIDTAAIEDKPSIILKGVIGGKIGFSMNLQQNGNEIEGTEHYDNQKTNAIIIIQGTIDDKGYITLHEYDDYVKTGSFRGIIEGSTYYGTFTNSKGKEMHFTADVLNMENMVYERPDIDKSEIEYLSFKKELEEFIKDTQRCIDVGLPTDSRGGLDYDEKRHELWNRYRQMEYSFTSEQKKKVHTLLNTLDNLFENWAAQEIDLSDYD